MKNPQTRAIYCCGCEREVSARLTNGKEAYPHRPDLFRLPFWRCDHCQNFVGCHHKTKNPTRPLGCIPTGEIKRARQHIHQILDPLWQTGAWNRREIYARITAEFGKQYHSAEIRTLDEARAIFVFIKKLTKERT